MAQKNIARNPSLEGAGLARTGIIVGWVGIALFVAFIVLGFAFLGIFSSSTNSDVPARFNQRSPGAGRSTRSAPPRPPAAPAPPPPAPAS